ncbi:MAG: hypothetical protein IJ398_05445 [Clostridia bacterium]|nr:hypothetical protein [Clostridia bacterium]
MLNSSPVELHKRLFDKITPSLRWDEKTPIDKWRITCQEKLSELLGLDTFEKCEADLKIVSESTLGLCKHIHFLVQTEKDYYVNAHLLVPKGISEKLPLCMGLQGHVSGAHIGLGIEKFDYDKMYINEDHFDYSKQCIDYGFVGLSIEQRGYGENGGDTETGHTKCTHAQTGAYLLGRTLIGERVWDIQRVLDAVLDYFGDIITMKGSLLIGTSGGGTATYYTACLENRFEVFLPGVALCSFADSIVALDHCICNYIPNIAKYFDMGDLAVMIAPKKLIILSATNDRWFPIEGAKREYERIEKIYKHLGAQNNLRFVIGNGGHSFYPNEVWQAIGELLEK